MSLTPDQEQILRHLLIPPCRVDVPSANSTGKTFVAAVALCWWFDNVNPGVVYSTAPRYEHVVNVLWGQMRLLRMKAGLASPNVGPRAPELYDTQDHFAVGITANRGESFQGRHIGRKLFLFDEATGLPPIYFATLRTMFDPEAGDAGATGYVGGSGGAAGSDAEKSLRGEVRDVRCVETLTGNGLSDFFFSVLSAPLMVESRDRLAPPP